MSKLSDLAAYCHRMAEGAETSGIPQDEAQLWAQLADEVDCYLHPDEPTEPLFKA